MLSLLPKTPSEVQNGLQIRFKRRRKTLKLTQQELFLRSGVSLGSLKRFENSGQIFLESLLKIALVLECLDDLERVCEEKEKMPESIEDLL